MYDNRLVLTPWSSFTNYTDSFKSPAYNKQFKTNVSQTNIDHFNRDILSNPLNTKYNPQLSQITGEVNNLTNTLDDYYAVCVKLNQPATMQGYMSFLVGKMSGNIHLSKGQSSIVDEFNERENRITDAQNFYIKKINEGLASDNIQKQKQLAPDGAWMQKRLAYINKLKDSQAAYVGTIKSSDSVIGEYVENIQNQNKAVRDNALANKQIIASTDTQTLGLNRLRNARNADRIATLGQTAANMALNSVIMFGVSTIISVGISWIQSWINHKKDLREAALEAADSLKKENETINDNISKIKELKEKLSDGTATQQEAYDARKQLIDIQSELYDSYSKELDGIDLVNGGLEEQLDLLRKIQKEKAKGYVIENSDAIENAREKINKKIYKNAPMSSSGDDSKFLDDFVYNYLEKYAKEHNNVELEKTETSYGGLLYGINASAKDQMEIWQNVYDEVEKYGKEQGKDVSEYLSYISKEYINKLTKKYGEDYKLLYNEAPIHEIQADDSLIQYYEDVTEAVENYNEAIASGEKGNLEINKISELRQQLLDGQIKDQYGTEINDEINRYFIDMFDKYIDNINIGNFKSGIDTEMFKKAFGTMTDIDVKNIPNNSKATKEQLEAFAQLESIADEYGINIDSAVDAMVDLKIVTGAVEKSVKSTAAAFDTMLEEYSKTQTGIEKFNAAYDKAISGQDLTADEVNELIALYPELIDKLEETQNGYTIKINDLIVSRNQYIHKELESESKEIISLQKQLGSYNKSLNEAQEKRKELEFELDSKKIVQPYYGSELKYGDKANYEETSKEIYSIQSGIDNCLKAEKDWAERIKETETELKQRKFLYRQTLASQSINWTKDFLAVSEAYSNLASIKSTASSEMAATGFLSSETAEQIMSSTDRWSECLTEVNGKIIFNAEAYQKLIEEESNYNSTVEKLTKTQQQYHHSLENKTAALKLLAKQYGVTYDESKSYLENLEAIKDKAIAANSGNKDVILSLTNLGDEYQSLTGSLENCNSELEVFLKIMQQISEENKISEALSDFEASVSKMQHKLQMGKITQNAFNAWYNSEWSKVKSGLDYGSLNSASQGIYNGFEETDYSQQLETQQSLYEKDKQNLDNALEDKTISYKEYCEQWQALNDKYFGKGTLLGSTEDGAKTYISNNREIAAYSKNTYDNIMSRIDRAIDTGVIDNNLFDDIKAIFGDEIPAEVLAAVNEAAASGKITYGQSSVLAKYLADDLLGTVPALADDYADALDDAAQRKASEFDKRMEDLDNKKETTNMSAEEYWGEREKARRELLENDTRLTKENEDEKRKILIGADKEIFDEKVKELDREKELGNITAQEYWNQRQKYADQYLKNNQALTEEYIDEQTSYATTALQEMYDEQANLLERQLKNGSISYKEYIDGLLQAWADFYKDRKGIEEESQAALEAIVDTTKSGVEEQISALENANEQKAHPYEVEIEALEEAKDAQDEYYDDCIDSMQDKLDLLEEEQEKEEKLKAIEEKRLSLLEAERNMYKNIRLVYAGNGQWVQKAREEDQKAVDEAEKALKEEQEQTEAEKLKKEIEKLQKEKEQYDKDIDEQIKELNKQITNVQEPLNDLIDILKLIVADEYNVDPDLIAQIINSEKGQAALEERNSDNEKKTEIYNENTKDVDKKENFAVDEETFANTFKELAKDNKELAAVLKSYGIDIDDYTSGTNSETKPNADEAPLSDTEKETTVNQPQNGISEDITAENKTNKEQLEPEIQNTIAADVNAIKNSFIPLSEYITSNDTIPENISRLADALDILSGKPQDNFIKTGIDKIDINKSSKRALDNINPISANIVTTVNVSSNSANGKDLANEIASVCETKISQAFTEFGNTFNNGLKKKLYGN